MKIEKLGITPLRKEPHDRLMSIVLTGQIKELEEQRNEMLEALIDVCIRAENTLRWAKEEKNIISKRANNYQERLIKIVEKASGRTWAEVKKLVNEI